MSSYLKKGKQDRKKRKETDENFVSRSGIDRESRKERNDRIIEQLV